MKLLAQILAVLLLLAAAGLAGITGLSHAVAATEPERALAVDSDQSDALLALAEIRRRSGEAKPEEIASLGARLIRSAPMLDAPLVYAGLNFAANQDAIAARHAFQSALKRQPRNILALSWLAADDFQSGRHDEALGALERLAVLDPQRSTFYAEVVTELVKSEGGVRALESHLANPTPLTELALARLNATSSDIPLLLRLNAHSTKGQAGLLDRLRRERGATQAYLAWLEFAPPLRVGRIEWPIDPAFVGDRSLLPFNWQIREGAELLEQGGLFARYNGRSNPVFARQVIMLGPGSYDFKAVMDGRSSAAGGAFEWAIACDGAGHPLGSVEMRSLTDVVANFAFNFTVPGDGSCPAQRLELRGRPGEFPERATAITRRVQIDRMAAANE